jgi:hypothetical protein
MTTTERRQFEANLFHAWMRRAETAETENAKLRRILAIIAPILATRLDKMLASLTLTEGGKLKYKGGSVEAGNADNVLAGS